MAALGTLVAGTLTDKVMGDVLNNVLPLLDDVIKSSVNSTKITEDEPLIKCNLAKSLDELKEHLKEMDETMKVMIGVTEKLMNKETDRSWEKIQSCMMQNPCVEPMGDEPIHTYDGLIKEDTTWFDYGGPADESKVLEVEQWIKKLISDEDVIKDLSFDSNVYAKIVAKTGADIGNFKKFFVHDEFEEKHVVDIGILRYPDMDHPYYKLYRVELKAWKGCHRILFVGKNSNGIKGDYHCQKFKPREKFIKELKESTRDKAKDLVDDLFND